MSFHKLTHFISFKSLLKKIHVEEFLISLLPMERKIMSTLDQNVSEINPKYPTLSISLSYSFLTFCLLVTGDFKQQTIRLLIEEEGCDPRPEVFPSC